MRNKKMLNNKINAQNYTTVKTLKTVPLISSPSYDDGIFLPDHVRYFKYLNLPLVNCSNVKSLQTNLYFTRPSPAALTTKNVMVKKQIFELLSALCYNSQRGYDMALEALQIAKVKHPQLPTPSQRRLYNIEFDLELL